MRPIFRQHSLDEPFREKGWIRTPLLNEREVARLSESIRALRPSDGFRPSVSNPEGHSYHCTFLDPSLEYRRASDRIIREVFSDHLEALMADYQILTSNIHLKPPGQGSLMIHQNWPSTANLADTTVTVWCPLVDVDENNGTVQFVEGSHKILPEVANFACEPYYLDFTERLKEDFFVPQSARAGEAIVFDDSLLHYSAANHSEASRIAIQIIMIPKEAAPVLYWLDSKDSSQFELLALDPTYYVEEGPALFENRPQLKAVGRVKNLNRKITEDEFVDLLGRGPQIRETLYRSLNNPEPRGFWSRLFRR